MAQGNFNPASPDAACPSAASEGATQPNSDLSDGEVREPPPRTWITLSEALSWMAFSFSTDSCKLDQCLQFSDPDQVLPARLKLIEKIDVLTAIASGGSISLRGKYIEHAGVDERNVRTKAIPAEAFHDFARFDVLYDGLGRGRGLARRFAPDGLDTGMDDLPWPAYHFVKVKRAEFLQYLGSDRDAPLTPPETGPATSTGRAPAVKAGRAPSEEDILAMADEMKASGLTGYQLAAAMRFEPGFADVATVEVRALIKGRWKGGRRKATDES